MDKILIRTQEELGKILKWGENNKKLIDKIVFPITKGIIEMNKAIINYEVKGDILHIIYDNGDGDTIFKANFNLPIIQKENKIVIKDEDFSLNPFYLHLLRDGKRDEFDFVCGICEVILSTMSYMAYAKEYRTQSIKERKEVLTKSSLPKNKKQKQFNKRNMTRIVYELSVDNTDNVKFQSNKEVNYSLPTWGRRGYEKTYKKTGKKVWVEPTVCKRNEDLLPSEKQFKELDNIYTL